MMIGPFISSLHPGIIFKDLIAQPPASMEDLLTHANNFIRAKEANMENRLLNQNGDRLIIRSRVKTIENFHGDKRKNISLVLQLVLITEQTLKDNLSLLYSIHQQKYTPNLKEKQRFDRHHECLRILIVEIEQNTVNFTKIVVMIQTVVSTYEEIENCLRNGRLSHPAKGARTQNSNQNPGTSRTANRGKGQAE